MIVGLDMGGTHIDGVIIKDNLVIRTIKKPTDPNDLLGSIWQSLKALLKDCDKKQIKRINLSTTISTNAIVENKISKVGLMIQSGPGVNNTFLACGDENQFLSGYIDHRGIEVEALDRVEVERAKHVFKENGIESVAVIGKFSTRNPLHEVAIKNILDVDFDTVTLGHRMSGKLNFPRRAFTAYLNSAVSKIFSDFSTSIKQSLQKEGIDTDIYILKADGGTMNLKSAEKKPVETILSGPAASFMGMSSFIETEEDAILLDIGGTTTDIFFLADKQPLFEHLGAKISKYNTLVRAVYSVSIGLGGDSAIRVEEGLLVIGPRREGRPYALGGPKATPTDAMIMLGLMNLPEDASQEKAERAMRGIGKQLNLSSKEAAQLILDTMALMIKSKTDALLVEINQKPIYTIKELLHGKRLEPKSVHVIGGPASVLSSILEKKYKLPCSYPRHYAVMNAIGAALAKPTLEITMLADTYQGKLTVPELGIYEKILKSYSLADAKKRAKDLLEKFALLNEFDQAVETEIIEENTYNIVRGFNTVGKNIRVKAQIKPGHILKLRGDSNESEK